MYLTEREGGEKSNRQHMRVFSNSIRSKDFNLRFSHTLLIYLFDRRGVFQRCEEHRHVIRTDRQGRISLRVTVECCTSLCVYGQREVQVG